jgi:hypothetical protein
MLTNHPGARLDGMAGQCLRGQLEAAWGSLHQARTGSTTPWRFHRRALTRHKHLSKLSRLSKLQHGEAPHRGCSEVADPEGKDHLDLLGEEAANDSIWWRWKRARRRVFCPRWRQRRPPELAGEARRRRRSSCRQGARGQREESEGLGWVGRPTQTRAGLA